jgi:hypothetical protein
MKYSIDMFARYCVHAYQELAGQFLHGLNRSGGNAEK